MQSCPLAKKIIQICVDALNKFLYVDAVGPYVCVCVYRYVLCFCV